MITSPPVAHVATPGKPAFATKSDPGRIDAAQLARYWRKESEAAAKRMASRLDIRCISGWYPWHAIWAAEGLAKPPATSWTVLQQNHLMTDEVAALLACDARTIRRYVHNPPDDFPPPVFESGRPWLWRSCQIYAYASGSLVPRFRRAPPIRTKAISARDLPPEIRTPKANTFNPFRSQ